MRKTALAELTPHPSNPRQGDVGAIVQSIEANGWVGSLVAQCSTGYVLAGNHRLQAAGHLGFDKVPVHWVDVDDETALRILLADNRTADLATYDEQALAQLLAELATDSDLEGTGYDGDDLDNLLADLGTTFGDLDHETIYTGKIIAPVYEPTGVKPAIEDLYDDSTTQELRQQIDDADLPDEVARFLHAAAERHTVYRFDAIAEFYAHAPAEIQELMERSALIIIDFEKAMEHGFVRMSKQLAELFADDHPERL